MDFSQALNVVTTSITVLGGVWGLLKVTVISKIDALEKAQDESYVALNLRLTSIENQVSEKYKSCNSKITKVDDDLSGEFKQLRKDHGRLVERVVSLETAHRINHHQPTEEVA